MHHLRDLNRCLDQAANMSMNIPVLGSAFGILVAAFIGAVQARDDGRYSLSPLKPWFDSLRSGKGPCCSEWGWCYVDEVMFDLSGRPTPHLGPIPRFY
jgi:hypothetical protein